MVPYPGPDCEFRPGGPGLPHPPALSTRVCMRAALRCVEEIRALDSVRAPKPSGCPCPGPLRPCLSPSPGESNCARCLIAGSIMARHPRDVGELRGGRTLVLVPSLVVFVQRRPAVAAITWLPSLQIDRHTTTHEPS